MLIHHAVTHVWRWSLRISGWSGSLGLYLVFSIWSLKTYQDPPLGWVCWPWDCWDICTQNEEKTSALCVWFENNCVPVVEELIKKLSVSSVPLLSWLFLMFCLFNFSYEFKVTPRNELGTGPSSEPVAFSTESGMFYKPSTPRLSSS